MAIITKKFTLPKGDGTRTPELFVVKKSDTWFTPRNLLVSVLGSGSGSDAAVAALRDKARGADGVAVEASSEELKVLRDSSAVGTNASKAILVEMGWGCGVLQALPKADVPLLRMAVASSSMELKPVPSELPAPESDGDDASDSDLDDEDGEAAGAHPPVYTAANRRYAVSEEIFTAGVCGEHVKLLEKYLTAPINLDRSGILLQGANSWGNIRSALRRYLGFCAQKKGEAAVAASGLLHILDGPSVGGFVAWLLQTRETSLVTCVQTMLALEKTAHWAVTEFFPEAPDGGAYVERMKTMTRQFQTWHAKCPVIKPSFEELRETGKFIELPDLLAKTIPFCEDALDAFQSSPTVETALILTQAAVLACTAGDGLGNVRPGQLAHLTTGGKGCSKPGCLIPRCGGSTVSVTSGGDAIFTFMHSKTSGSEHGAVVINCDASTITAQVWRALVESGQVILRGDSDTNRLLLNGSGEPLTEKAVGALVNRSLAAAGCPKTTTSRTCRRSVIVDAMRNVPADQHEALATQMGNSPRAWRKSYDVELRVRQARAAKATYHAMVARSGAGGGSSATGSGLELALMTGTGTISMVTDPMEAAAPVAAGGEASANAIVPVGQKRGRSSMLEDILKAREDRIKAAQALLLAQRGGAPAGATAAAAASKKAGGRPKLWMLKKDAPDFLTPEDFKLLNAREMNKLIPEFYDWVGIPLPAGVPPTSASSNRGWLRAMLCGRDDAQSSVSSGGATGGV